MVSCAISAPRSTPSARAGHGPDRGRDRSIGRGVKGPRSGTRRGRSLRLERTRRIVRRHGHRNATRRRLHPLGNDASSRCSDPPRRGERVTYTERNGHCDCRRARTLRASRRRGVGMSFFARPSGGANRPRHSIGLVHRRQRVVCAAASSTSLSLRAISPCDAIPNGPDPSAQHALSTNW